MDECQGVAEHRWIGLIVPRNQTAFANKLIKCKTSDSVGTIVSQCVELESSKSVVVAIYGSQNCIQVSSILQLMLSDISYVSWNYLRNEFLLCVFSCERYSTRPRDFFRTKISFWCFDGVKQKLHALFLDAKALILCFGKLFPHVTLLLIF